LKLTSSEREQGAKPQTVTLRQMLSLFPVTYIITGICALVFMLSSFGDWRVIFYWLHFPDLGAGQAVQLWRWVTPAFFHFGLLHIGFNLLWWYLLGRIVEYRQGSFRLALIFFVAAVAPNLAQYLVSGVGFGGLSGVVYGLFGYVWLYGHLRPKAGLFMPVGVMVQILAWLVLGFTGLLEQWVKMANTAHLVGLLSGLILALVASQLAPTVDNRI